MSLGDYLRLLRARRGGVTPWEIESATNLPKGLYRQMEQRYRAVGDDTAIEALATFYGLPASDLRWRLDWPRKGLSRALVASVHDGTPITLHLWDGEQVTGEVVWWDLGATALEVDGGRQLVVQRHAVERWEPRADDDGTMSEEAFPKSETGGADTSGADTSGADTSGADTSGADTSGADTGSDEDDAFDQEEEG
jgi:sRNA-binding regulator protein Hfq